MGNQGICCAPRDTDTIYMNSRSHLRNSPLQRLNRRGPSSYNNDLYGGLVDNRSDQQHQLQAYTEQGCMLQTQQTNNGGGNEDYGTICGLSSDAIWYMPSNSQRILHRHTTMDEVRVAFEAILDH